MSHIVIREPLNWYIKKFIPCFLDFRSFCKCLGNFFLFMLCSSSEISVTFWLVLKSLMPQLSRVIYLIFLISLWTGLIADNRVTLWCCSTEKQLLGRCISHFTSNLYLDHLLKKWSTLYWLKLYHFFSKNTLYCRNKSYAFCATLQRELKLY